VHRSSHTEWGQKIFIYYYFTCFIIQDGFTIVEYMAMHMLYAITHFFTLNCFLLVSVGINQTCLDPLSPVWFVPYVSPRIKITSWCPLVVVS
jgi:hypothetical protein